MTALWKKELHSYFYTPIGYVFMGVFLILSGLMFYILNIAPSSSNIPYFMGSITYLWLPLVPVLTMRLLAEERQRKTDQLLLTSPLSISAIVIGKFLAAASVVLLTVFITLAYVGYTAIYSTIYPGEIMVAYTGFILQGLCFVAINLFISAITKSQVSAAIGSLGINFLLWIINVLATSVPNPTIAAILNFFSLYNRYLPFEFGQLSFASILYYLSFIGVFLVATIIAVHQRRWRDG